MLTICGSGIWEGLDGVMFTCNLPCNCHWRLVGAGIIWSLDGVGHASWLNCVASSKCWLSEGSLAGLLIRAFTCNLYITIVSVSHLILGFSRAHVPRESGGYCLAFSYLASEVRGHHFFCILLVKTVTNFPRFKGKEHRLTVLDWKHVKDLGCYQNVWLGIIATIPVCYFCITNHHKI